MSKERILITGGAGYLGSVATGVLLNRGHKVTVLDSLIYRQHSLFQYCTHPDFEFVRGDARDKDVVGQLVKKADTIISLAAIVGMNACNNDPIMATSTNFDAVKMLNELRSPEQKMIYPCTNSGYGTKTGAVHCTEETPMEPISLYGIDKVNAEKEVLSKRNSVSFRLATVFGPSARMRTDLLVNDFVLQALTQKTLVIFEKDFKRNFVHTGDVADAFAFAIENFGSMQGQAYNLGLDNANLSKEELALAIKEYIPSLYIHFAETGSDPDKRNYIVSNAKLKAKGFEATRSLKDGICQLMKLYKMLPIDALKNA